LGAHRSKQLVVTGYGTQFRARNRFHRVDQHRQPQALAARRSPSLDLLTHRLSFRSVTAGNSKIADPFPISHFAVKKITFDVIYFTEAPGGPSYISVMSRQTYSAPFDSDIRIDYALIAFGVGAALFAFIYLILV
jgi:hypothetical protein